MIPADIRTLTWNELREYLAGPRERVWDWLHAHGPATTSTIAAGLEMNLLTVRPRVCELVQLGFAECVDRDGREGVYRALTMAVSHNRHAEALRERQLNLPLQ